MAGKPSDHLINALNLLRKAAAGKKSASGAKCTVALRELETLLLADLKARRTRVREWIGILEHAAACGGTAPRGWRNAGRRSAAGRARRVHVSGVQ